MLLYGILFLRGGMSNFSYAACHDYWYNFKDASVYKVINFMESVEESWTIDGDEDLEKALECLADSMADIENIDIKHPEKFIILMAQLRMSRSLHILQSLDTAFPGAAAKILEYADRTSERSADAKLFLSRHAVFERLRLLSRLLAPDRLVLVQSAIEESRHA